MASRTAIRSSRILPLLQQQHSRRLPSLLLARSTPLGYNGSVRSSARSFQSSAVAAGSWTPSWSWIGMGGTKPAAPETATSIGQEEQLAPEKVTTLDPEPVAATPAPSPSDLSSTSSDLASTPVPSDLSTGFFYDGISTGSLDLTPLVGSWGPHPIMRLQSMFLHLHESFPLLSGGLPWYILVPTVTIFLRLVLFTFQVRSQANTARMAIIQPQMLAGMNKVKAAKARGDVIGQQAAQMEVAKLMSDNNVNPIKNLVFPLAQGIVFMTTFFALRGLGGSGLESLQTEGMAWFTDLTARDPYWVLPVASTSLTLATLETGVDSSTQVQTTTTKNMKMLFRGMLVLSLPFIAYFPAILLLYWTTNNFVSLIQSHILKLPVIRKVFNIPIVPPKAQPGEPGYVKEPGFMEAFKDMQSGARDKWDETVEKAEEKKAMEERRKGVRSVYERSTVYEPKKVEKNRVRKVLEEVSGEVQPSGTNEIRAEVRGKEEEKQRRVQQARLRRQQRQ